MLKPVTQHEKARFTLDLNVEKAIFELLDEMYYNGYNGLVEIQPKVEIKNHQLLLTVVSKQITVTPKNTKESIVFQMVQGKGYKQVK